ncbi:hypothetical protein [Parapedobacter sp.]
MNKLTKIGLNAMVVFTMMFATTVVVAQEKVVASDNVEVKESVEAYALANTLKKMKSSKMATGNDHSKAIENSHFADLWLQITPSGTPTEPENQEVTEEGNTDPFCVEPDGTICAVELNYNPTAPAIAALLNRIGTSNPPTVAEFLDAGASYTGSNNEAVYTYKD